MSDLYDILFGEKESAVKAFFYTDEEGQVRFAGGPGGGGGSTGGSGGKRETAAERSKRERAAIESNEYLTVMDEGEFDGYHWTNPANRWTIEKQGLRGVPWNEDLGFTRSTPELSKEGAVFAFTSLNRDEGADWGSNAVVFKVHGYGYLVHHSQEGLQYILRADQSKAEYAGTLRDIPRAG
jgi:hypothetical protein